MKGFINAVSASFTEDKGRKLENLIYLHLRRKYKELFFFKEKGECDFWAFTKGKLEQVIQVCYQINDENFEREYNGLIEALRFFGVKQGSIVTMNQKDRFEQDGHIVDLIPAFEFLTLN